ncbi:MAG: hypothetical protein VKL59_23450 [Nostocaceae cyanobacterium]|nr:hypothetical protein [Nostocaceae cyanobacterium]
MSYSDFNLPGVKQAFSLTTFEKVNIFADCPEVECSSLLNEILAYNVPIATANNSEKARSEMIIAPILIDVRRQFQEQINLFSGVDFSVDAERGLNGTCDFIISRSPEVLVITAPVIIIVEAKKENINSGLGQCIAEMVAARIFNERQENPIPIIHGVVTSGTNWRFLKLENQVVSIDLSEYYLRDIKKIMGIITSAIDR